MLVFKEYQKKYKRYTYILNYSDGRGEDVDDFDLNLFFSFSSLLSFIFVKVDCSAFLDLFKTFWTIPAVSKVVIRSLCEAHARKVEPFVTAVRMIACHHIAVGYVLAEAVRLFHLISHGLNLIKVRPE